MPRFAVTGLSCASGMRFDPASLMARKLADKMTISNDCLSAGLTGARPDAGVAEMPDGRQREIGFFSEFAG